MEPVSSPTYCMFVIDYVCVLEHCWHFVNTLLAHSLSCTVALTVHLRMQDCIMTAKHTLHMFAPGSRELAHELACLHAERHRHPRHVSGERRLRQRARKPGAVQLPGDWGRGAGAWRD